MSFMDSLKETLDQNTNISVTENGARGFKTTGAKLLDMNYQVSSLRNKSEQTIIKQFEDVFLENRLLAIKWLFFVSDVRGGLGERRLFRICLKHLGEQHIEYAKAVLELVPFYNRWDNLLCLLDTKLADEVVQVIKAQLEEDMDNRKAGKSISLLTKWLPSVNASSKETKRLAHILIKKLEITERQYRKLLSVLRAYLKVVEVSMSKREWSAIDYSAVPSRANLVYNRAFLRNDEERRKAYLEGLKAGEERIHAEVLFPHDIVHKYCENRSNYQLKAEEPTLEALWKALPDYVEKAGNTICVADGSGSMTTMISGTRVRCLDVANALAIYFAERSSGQFKDTYITFSQTPKLVDLSHARSLKEKIEIAFRHNEVANTNIEAVFQLILQTAVSTHMEQKDLPKNILILSDMEFDACASSNSLKNHRYAKPDRRLFEEIAKQYASHGYQIPRMVFWNICSRTGTIPVKENNLGVALVSGFSPSIVKMVLSNATNPYECLLEQINAERYDAVEKAVAPLL